MKRQIITIDEKLCTGCGLCIPNCPEGALQIIDGKARLISDLFCDGLGACIGHCPEGAIATETREAEPYDESKVMENIARCGPNVIKAHLAHLRDHKQDEYFREALAYLVDRDIEIPAEFFEPACRCGEGFFDSAFAGCGLENREFRRGCGVRFGRSALGRPWIPPPPGVPAERPSRLRQWPVQIMLVPPNAPVPQRRRSSRRRRLRPLRLRRLPREAARLGASRRLPKLDAEHYLEAHGDV